MATPIGDVRSSVTFHLVGEEVVILAIRDHDSGHIVIEYGKKSTGVAPI